jgi:hypothetical protein
VTRYGPGLARGGRWQDGCRGPASAATAYTAPVRYPQPYFAPPFQPDQPGAGDNARALAIPGYRQVRNYTCGYAVALMALRYWRPEIGARELYERLGTTRDGTRQNALVGALRGAGLRANVRYDVDFQRLQVAIDRGKLIVGYHHAIEHWVLLYGYGVEPERVFVADSRAGEPCEHLWSDYGPVLRGFGIVCSARPAAGVREGPEVAALPARLSAPDDAARQLRFDF